MYSNTAFRILVAGVLSLLLAASAWAEGAKSIAIALSTKGAVEVKKSGQDWTELTFGTVLDGGDRVRTGNDGFVALVFTDDKSQIKLRPGTDIVLNAERTADNSLTKRVNMEIGELFAEVKKQKGSLQVSTPTAVASVKGTKFWVLVAPDGSTQELTLEGVVELLSLITGESIEVIAGQLGAVDTEGNIIYEEIDQEDVPQFLEELEIDYIEIEFRDEEGNLKHLIIQYQSGEGEGE